MNLDLCFLCLPSEAGDDKRKFSVADGRSESFQQKIFVVWFLFFLFFGPQKHRKPDTKKQTKTKKQTAEERVAKKGLTSQDNSQVQRGEIGEIVEKQRVERDRG